MGAAHEVARRALLPGSLPDPQASGSRSPRAGRATPSGPPTRALRARIEVLDPRAYTLGAARQHRARRGLRRGAVAQRRPRRPEPDRLPQPAAARRACAAACIPLLGPIQRAAEPRAPQHPRGRAGEHLGPLRPRQRALRGLPRRAADATRRPSSRSRDSSLEDAQLLKLERICDGLALGPDDHLLEIGTGWGGLAIHAASTRGCRVTTTTISREQHAYAVERVREAGLDDRIEILLTRLPRPQRQLRQAGLDRDDRGGRLAVLPRLLRQVLRAHPPRRSDVPAGDRDRRRQLRGREGVAQLLQQAHLPRRLPAVASS